MSDEVGAAGDSCEVRWRGEKGARRTLWKENSAGGVKGWRNKYTGSGVTGRTQ